MQRSPEFVIRIHGAERIVEVTYPSHPSHDAYESYEQQLRAAANAMAGQWDCLVDQRNLTVAPPDISERITQLNAWARKNGMRHSARVVKESAIAELQARRILRESGLEEHSVFHSREEAWTALLQKAARR